MFNCVFVTFPCGILGQMGYLIVSIPDLCCLSYFVIEISSRDSLYLSFKFHLIQCSIIIVYCCVYCICVFVVICSVVVFTFVFFLTSVYL